MIKYLYTLLLLLTTTFAIAQFRATAILVLDVNNNDGSYIVDVNDFLAQAEGGSLVDLAIGQTVRDANFNEFSVVNVTGNFINKKLTLQETKSNTIPSGGSIIFQDINGYIPLEATNSLGLSAVMEARINTYNITRAAQNTKEIEVDTLDLVGAADTGLTFGYNLVNQKLFTVDENGNWKEVILGSGAPEILISNSSPLSGSTNNYTFGIDSNGDTYKNNSGNWEKITPNATQILTTAIVGDNPINTPVQTILLGLEDRTKIWGTYFNNQHAKNSGTPIDGKWRCAYGATMCIQGSIQTAY